MPRFDEQYLGNHRRQRSLVLVMSLLGLLIALAPRQERALFLATGMPVSAFGAVFPPINLATLNRLPGDDFGARDTPAAFFARTPPRPAAGASPFVDAPAAGPLGGTPGEGNPVVGSAGPGDVGPSATPASDGGGGLPFIPVAFNQPAAAPVAPAATSTPAAVPTPTPTPTTSAPSTPVPAVPEPATWLMLIVGFFAMGAGFRARRPVCGVRGMATR